MSLFEVLVREEKTVKNPEKLRRQIDSLIKHARSEVNRRQYREAASLFHEAADLSHRLNERISLDYTMEAAKLYIREKDYFNAAWEFRNASLITRDWREYTRSEGFLNKAIGLFSALDRNYAVKWCYNLLGEIREERGDIYGAFEAYGKSMEIQEENEIRERIELLTKKLPHLFVYPETGKDSCKKGEVVKFRLVAKNISNYEIDNIVVRDQEKRTVSTIDVLYPGEEKEIQVSKTMNMKPIVSPFDFITYRLPDNRKVTEEIREIVVRPRPDIDIDFYLDGRPEAGKFFYVILSVKNSMRKEITNLNINIDFPDDIKATPLGSLRAGKMKPGDRNDFIFRALSMNLGKGSISAEIHFESDGKNFSEILESVVNEIPGKPEELKVNAGKVPDPTPEGLQKISFIQRERIYFRNTVKPISFEETSFLHNEKLNSSLAGFRIKSKNMKLVSNQLIEEFRWIYSNSDSGKDSETYYFSGESVVDGGLLLLKTSLKKEKDEILFALKGFTDKEGIDKTVGRFSDIYRHSLKTMSGIETDKISQKEMEKIIGFRQ